MEAKKPTVLPPDKAKVGSKGQLPPGKQQLKDLPKDKETKKVEEHKQKQKQSKSKKAKPRKPSTKSGKSGRLSSALGKTTSSALKSGKGTVRTGSKAAKATTRASAATASGGTTQVQKSKIQSRNTGAAKGSSITKSGTAPGSNRAGSAIEDLMSVYQDEAGVGPKKNKKSSKGSGKKKKQKGKSANKRRSTSIPPPPRHEPKKAAAAPRPEKVKILFRDPKTELETIVVINDDGEDPVTTKSFGQQIDDFQHDAGDCICFPNNEIVMRLKKADDAACLCGHQNGAAAYSVQFDNRDEEFAGQHYPHGGGGGQTVRQPIRRPSPRPGSATRYQSRASTHEKSSSKPRKTKNKSGKSTRGRHSPEKRRISQSHHVTFDPKLNYHDPVGFDPPSSGHYSKKKTSDSRYENDASNTYPFTRYPQPVARNRYDFRDLVKPFPSSENANRSTHHRDVYSSSVSQIESASKETESASEHSNSTETSATSTTNSASSTMSILRVQDGSVESLSHSVRLKFVGSRKSDDQIQDELTTDSLTQQDLIGSRTASESLNENSSSEHRQLNSSNEASELNNGLASPERKKNRSKSLYDKLYSDDRDLPGMEENRAGNHSLDSLPKNLIDITELMKGLETKNIKENSTLDQIAAERKNTESQQDKINADSVTSMDPLPSGLIYYYSSDSLLTDTQQPANNYGKGRPSAKRKPFWKRLFHSFTLNKNACTKSVRVQTLKRSV